MRSALLPQVDRRVGKLRIRASDEGDARHVSIVLLDALRTASVPTAEQGQMLTVRNLPLGRISPRASVATLALQIERAMREARLSAVHYALPAAERANAVIFPGRAEALVALARLHTWNIEPKEWFWRAVVPGWSAPLSRAARWLMLLEAAHSLPEAAIASALILREALRANVEDELLSSIHSGLGADWLRLEGWSWSSAASLMSDLEIAGPEPDLCRPSERHQEVINRWERSWGWRSERLVWLATILAVAENPARAADGRLPLATAKRLASLQTNPKPKKRDASANGFGPPRESTLSSSVDPTPAASAKLVGRSPLEQSKASASPEADAKRAGPSSFDETGTATYPEAEVTRGSAESDEAQRPEMRLSSGEFTSCAGLLFLASILSRLGFADFLTAHPELLEAGFPARLLRFVGGRVGLQPDDPLALALEEPSASEPPPLFWELPGPARALLALPVPRVRLDSPLVAWLTVARRWCRRRARIGLVTLIRRPGRVTISQTQIDVCFDIAAADLRLRRLALDVDPGWVPWLGRVVRFHYLAADENAI